MNKFITFIALAFISVSAGYIVEQHEPITPRPSKLRQFIVDKDLEARQYQRWNYTREVERVGRRVIPGLVHRMVLTEAIRLDGPGTTSGSPTFTDFLNINHSGATGVNLTIRVNTDNNWAYWSSNLRVQGNAYIQGTFTAETDMLVVNATQVLSRSNSLVQYSIGTVGTPWLDIQSTGIVAGLIIASGVGSGNTAISLTQGAYLQLGAGSIGFRSTGVVLEVTGALPMAPTSDQGINIGTSSIRFSNAYFAQYNALMGTSGTLATVPAVATINTTTQGNGADTTEDNLQTYSLPANSMSANGKGVRYTAWGDNNGISTTDVMTVKCYFGATAILTRVLTASQATTWQMTFEVIRTGATTQIASGSFWQGGATTALVQSNASPAETLSGAVTIKCTGQRATTSAANSVRQLGGIVEFFN